MQFQDFFPRLRARAFERYGQVVTERQFKDWREDNLLPGPAAPQGKSRGQSPERHWPVASYRRALRICRYKAWEANRSSLWRIGFWISGETTDAEQLRKDLNRQLKTLHRAQRGIAESGRWLNTTFTKPADIESSQAIPRGAGAGWLKLYGISPDHFRRQIASLFEEPEGAADIHLINETLDLMWRDYTPHLKVDAEFRRYHRAGYLSDPDTSSGTFIDRSTARDFALCVAIRRLQRTVALFEFRHFVAEENRHARHFLIHLFQLLANSNTYAINSKVPPLLKILFEIDCDKRDGMDPRRRLECLEIAFEHMRSDLQTRLSELRASGNIGYIRPIALFADLDASIALERSGDR